MILKAIAKFNKISQKIRHFVKKIIKNNLQMMKEKKQVNKLREKNQDLIDSIFINQLKIYYKTKVFLNY